MASIKMLHILYGFSVTGE